MKGKVKCTCGWEWNKSDSSKKDMYICHECGRDNSNNISKAQNGVSSKDVPTPLIPYSNEYIDSLENNYLNLYNNPSTGMGDGYDDFFHSMVDNLPDVTRKAKGWVVYKPGTDIEEFTEDDGTNSAPNPGKNKMVKRVEDYEVSDRPDVAEQVRLAKYMQQRAINKLDNRTVSNKGYDIDIPKQKNGGWLDNYGEEANANEGHSSASKEWVGDGYSNAGRNYSPAWGGQFQEGGEIPNAQSGEYFKKKVKKTEKDILKKYIDPVQKRAIARAKQQGINTGIHNGPLDAIRHSSSAAAMASTLPNWTNFIPGVAPLKMAATNIAGVAHEINAPNTWREHASDLYNNFIGSVAGVLPISEESKHDLLIQAQKRGVLSNMGDKTPLRKKPGIKKSQTGESVYPVNYVPQAQDGGLTFLQPTSDKLPEGYRFPYADPSSERAMSIGGENGEPAYLIPSFKYGKELYTPIEEFKRTGEHLGGPFKTWQEAEEWENTVRHPAVENRETIMFPQEKFQTGGSMPGAVGFSYARIGAPSKGPRRNQTDVTDASAQDGKEVDMYGNPIIAKQNHRYDIDRSYYDPRKNIINLGADYASWANKDKLLAHENYHAKQHEEGRDNFDIGHNTENRQWAEMQKRPEIMSTPEVWNNFYNRKGIESDMAISRIAERLPESQFFRDAAGDIIYNKIVDPTQYDIPYSFEGEAQYYEDNGVEFQNGGEMRYYQNGLDWKPKSIGQEGTQVVNSRQKRGLDLLIKETNNAKKDKQELQKTGQIKNPKSIHYKKLAPKQSELRTQTKSNEELEGKLGFERPLIYLANPEKLLGDIGVPDMETSELDRQAVMANRFNPNQTRLDRFINHVNIGTGYVPEATVNTAMAAAFMPEGSGVLGLVNESLNPFAGMDNGLFKNIKTSVAPELRQGLRTNGIVSPEYLEGLKRTATKKLFDSRAATTEENLKRLKLLMSPKTLKAIGNVDAPIADKMLYGFMTNKYPSVKQFRTDVKKSILEANRIKKLNPGFDFSPDILKHPDLVNHANDYLLSKPEYLSNFVNAKKAAEKTIANKQNVKSFLEKEYVKKMDLINQDPILKNIAQESPQYVDDIYDHLKNPTKSTDEFVNDLIKQSNTFTRSMHKSMKSGDISKEDFFTPQGSSMGFTNKKTIDVEGFPTSDIRGEYGNDKYKIFPNEERMLDITNTPLEERWAKRFPNTFAGNENIDFGLGVHSGVENDFLHKAIIQRRIRNNMLVNRGSAPIQPKIITSEIIPEKYLYQPKHVVFNTPEANQLVKGFDVEQVSDTWNKFKPEGPFGLHPGYTKGFKQGGIIKDDNGYWNPDNWDSPVEIGSNEITMQDVPFDVLGISDEGDVKHMKANNPKNYKYKGKKVTEFRMAQNGLRQEQKGLVNLDNLTNFTNYNTKQPGGWLDTL